MGECRRTVGGAELRALGAGSCCEAADLDEVVGEDAVPGPDPGSFGAVDAGAVPTVVSFEGADAAFAAGAPLDCSSERWPLFFGAPGLGGSAFTRYRDRTYTEVVQVIFDAFLAVAAVGGDGAGRASGACGDPSDRGR